MQTHRTLLRVSSIAIAWIIVGATSTPSLAGLPITPNWILEGSHEGEYLSGSISAAGDVNADGYSDVLVASPYYENGEANEGKVSLFLGSPTGTESNPAWTIESNHEDALFGSSVAGVGDVNGDGFDDVLIGAGEFTTTERGEGKVFLYLGGTGGLNTAPAWTVEGEHAADVLGSSVAGAGDVNGDGFMDVIIGAPGFDGVESDCGQVRVYLGSSSGLSATPAWTAEGNPGLTEFGYCVSTAGDVNGDGFDDVIIGTRQDDEVHVYHGSPAGPSPTPNWTKTGQLGSAFGVSVSTAGDVDGDGYSDIIIGAPLYNSDQVREGVAYVFHGSPVGLAPNHTWYNEGGQDFAEFGWNVATAGDVTGSGYSGVLVGSGKRDGGEEDEGIVRFYPGGPLGVAFQSPWTMQSGQANAQLGDAVAAAGDVNGDGFGDILVGAPYFDTALGDAGRAELYLGSGNVLGYTGWSGLSAQPGSRMGFTTAAGDFNGDGYTDVVGSAPGFELQGASQGRVYVHYGNETGPADTPSWFATGESSQDYFGNALSSAGDVNGDGYDDLIIAAPGYEDFPTSQGKVYLYLGSFWGLESTPSWTVTSSQFGSWLGWSVASAGDVNGDGFGDFLIGEPFYDDAFEDVGRVTLYLGSPTGPSAAPDWERIGTVFDGGLGNSVSSAGDVNGDGYSDVIIGSSFHDFGSGPVGAAFVYLGGAGGLDTTPAWTGAGDSAGVGYGYRVATVGDVNGDGFSDVAVGAPWQTVTHSLEGRALVYLGSANGPSTSPDWQYNAAFEGARTGHHLSAAGDVDGDGFGDMLVSAPRYQSQVEEEGVVWLFRGSPTGPQTAPSWQGRGGLAGAEFGLSVSPAGDVNGDGFADVVIGAPFFSFEDTDDGRFFVRFGNDTVGLARRPVQRLSDGLTPIPLLGLTEEDGSFTIRAFGRSGWGRSEVRMEWEVKPLGQAFDGNGIQTTGWFDTGTPSAPHGSRFEFQVPVTGLQEGQVYRWRYRFCGNSHLFPRTPWFTPAGNSPTESDLRVPGATTSTPDLTVDGSPLDEAFLGQARPNPFHARARIDFSLANTTAVRITVHDATGRRVATLVDANLEAGEHRTEWNGEADHGKDLPAGVYLVRLATPGGQMARQVIMMD